MRLTDIYGAGMATDRPEPDTDPEPFGSQSNQDTAKRCYQCGHEASDTFDAGRTWTVRQLRKWLAKRMTAGEAIAVTGAFVRDTRA